MQFITGGNKKGGGLPPGGTTGQALVKNTNANEDVKWATIEPLFDEFSLVTQPEADADMAAIE